MAKLILALALCASLVGCGGAGGGSSTNIPPSTENGHPHGRFYGTCSDLNEAPIGCIIEVDGENVTFYTQSGTGGLPGRLKGNKLDVWAFDDLVVNVERHRIWRDGRIDVRGGD